MSVPLPPTDLEGHCSAIHNNTLYVLSPTALQSLSLATHAEWDTLPLGQSVTGPACVTATPDDNPSDAAMYVIGGQTTDDSFAGLQRFFFANQTWETLSPPVGVLAGRFNHSAAYLNDSQSILVYAGSQPSAPSYLSSQTFSISTQPPYNVLSYKSNAPPGHIPIVQPWNSSHALMVGGSDLNKQVWLFAPEGGWTKFPTELTQTLETSTRSIVVELSNGAKVLEVYNMSVSPNTVTDVVLVDAHGKPAQTGQTLNGGSLSRKPKRDLTLSNWPAYNGTNAPTTIRAECSIAQSPDGLVVIAGGDNNVPLILFNQADNSWINAGQYFDDPSQQPLQPSSTPSATPSASASATPGGESAHDRTMRTLGITLGVIFGVAAIFVAILLLLRRRKLRQRKVTEQQQAEKEETEGRMSFTDRGTPFMKETGASLADLLPPSGHRFDPSRASNSSLAIFSGKFGNRRSTNGHVAATSFDSTAQLVGGDKPGNPAVGEQIEMMDIGEKIPVPTLTVPGMAADGTPLDSEAKARRKRSSGWSKYFATSQPNRLSHLPSAYAKSHSVILDGGAEAAGSSSQPHTLRAPSFSLAPPANSDTAEIVNGQRVSNVPSSSPSYSDSREDLVLHSSNIEGVHAQQGTIVNSDEPRKSLAHSVSSYGNRSTVSSNLTSEFFSETNHTPWTPMNNSYAREIESRPASSVYTDSVDFSNRIPSRGKSAGFFPGPGNTYRPSPKPKMSYAAGPTSEWAAPPTLPFVEKAADRDSNVTVSSSAIPDGEQAQSHNTPSEEPQQVSGAAKPTNTDMSWLNLGLNQESR